MLGICGARAFDTSIQIPPLSVAALVLQLPPGWGAAVAKKIVFSPNVIHAPLYYRRTSLR